jgi:alpha-D-xyloside xylohydrolase
VRGLGLLAGIFAAGGCYENDRPPATVLTRPSEALTAGGYAVRVDPDARAVTLVRGDVTLLDFPADALQLGVVGQVDDMVNYDPFAVVSPTALHQPPDDLVWLAPTHVDVTLHDAGALDLALTYSGDRAATLHVEAKGAGSFRLTLTPTAGAGAVAYFRLRPRADKDEGFYGLGEQFDDVNQRGKIRAMQIEIDGSTESGYNNVHVPVPLLVGTRGWGLFVESPYPGAFAVATDEADRVDALFGTGLASKDGLVFHLFGEEKPLDVTRHYYDVTGYPRLPAPWALGPWVWRDENKDQAQAEGDLQAMRDLDLPATAYWVDRPYATGVNTFDWYPPQFPEPQKLIDKAHDLGFGFALWHTPYLDKKAAETKALRDEAEQKGYFPLVSGVALNPWGKLIDFTNPDAYSWWQEKISTYTLMGVEGFKLDYAEDVVPGLTSGRNVWEFADGRDERTMHAEYQLLYHQAYAELLPQSGSFLLCRAGTYGDQQTVSVIWPGDLDAAFAKNGETALDENGKKYVAVGGLPGSLIAGLSLGPSGFPFFGADTGGYLHSPPDKELFMRWFEQTALSTVMQIGNSASTVAWEPDAQTGYDAEMLDAYRAYTRLHLRLFPYEWTYARQLAKDGRPIARPLGLAYPEMGQHPNDVYMFGDALLVAPVLERGATARAVPMPPGRWVDWWTGEVVAGGATKMADAPLDRLPLWLAEGGIVPMLRPTIDTLRATGQPSLVDSYATDPGVLWARVAPGPASSFTVFDGATLTQERQGGVVKLGATDGKEFVAGVMFEVIALGKKPTHVTDGGAPLAEMSLDALVKAKSGWAWAAAAGGTAYVKTPAGAHAVELGP